MKKDALQGAEKYTKAYQRKKRWYRVVTGLACVVVFCTVYALILPAITMEKGACEIPEHTHSEACYTQVTSATRTEPVCTIESLNLHQHDDTCYDSEGNLTCGYADFVVHQHDSACYDENGNLWCPLPEIETHEHTGSCYAVPETDAPEVHTHTEECSTAEETEATEETEETTEPEEEMSGMEIDPSLPVMGTAYASGAKTRAYSVMTLDADTTGATDPVSVENYITGATLYYRTNENGEWTDVSGATDIPGNADFKLVISYGNVPIDDLLAAGGKMTYTLPGLLRNATANGSITSGSTTVGTITVANNTVTLAFDTTWLAKQKTETNTVISGDFFVEAEVNLSQVGEDGTGQIVIGNTTINIDFAGDIVAKYGNVDLSKTVSAISEETDGDYLTYTLTVKAGADGCPEVKVVDTFADTQHIEEYVGVTGGSSATNDTDGPTETGGTGSVYIGAAPTEDKPIPDPAGENPTKPGTLVWVIGNMGPNETRTLTYRVKLKDAYTGVTAKENLQNTANVYSKTYQRDSDTVTFTPRAGATMSKVASTFTPGENGGGTITYTIWVKANADNSYVLDNVKIMDALDGSIESRNGTLAAIRQYLSYDETSFHLYQGGSNGQNGSSGLTEITAGTTLTEHHG